MGDSGDDTPATFAEFRAWLHNGARDNHGNGVVVIPARTHVVISIDWTHGNVVVDGLAVEPAHRREGVGAALIRVAEFAAGELGLPRVVVECSPRNADALAFYARLGYVPVSTVLQKDVEVKADDGSP
jgi:GNAT superfamily N-acetyltransferase